MRDFSSAVPTANDRQGELRVATVIVVGLVTITAFVGWGSRSDHHQRLQPELLKSDRRQSRALHRPRAESLTVAGLRTAAVEVVATSTLAEFVLQRSR